MATYSFNSYKLAGAIHNYSIQYNLEANLLISIAYIESRFQRHAISSVGCLSYFQINSKAHSIDYTRIHEEYYNTRWGSMILVDQLHKYDNNELLALNGYNGWASYKNPYANNVLKIKRRLDKI
ncbi:MAG: transglycosylase SLT domain-containing protein [Mariniphaga sp.]|nr:transglycosylase SLT domain-containing protein [Mariniphaga sp.]